MRTVQVLAIALLASAALVGCNEETLESHDGKGAAKISLNNGKVAIHSDDGDGTKSKVEIDGAHIDIDSKDGKFKMDADGDTFKMKANDKDSSFENGVTITEAELGLPFYPGSTEVKVASMKAETKSERTFISVRQSTDSPEKVIAFYRPLVLEPELTTKKDDSRDEQELKGKDKDGNKVAVSASRENGNSNSSVTVVHVVNK